MSELREAIEAAFEQDESEQTPEETSEAPDFAPKEGEPSNDMDSSHDSDMEDATEEAQEQREVEEPTPEQQAKPAPEEKAPASWTPKARETWGKLPPEARAEVMKREREINQVLQQSANARHAMKELTDTLAPYKDGLIASGVQNPIQEIGMMLATESRLRAGSQSEKANTIAALIKSYGVDIRELDNVLSNQGYGQQQQSSGHNMSPDIQRLLDERLAPVNQFLQQQQQQQQWQAQQERMQATQTVEQFAQKAEFLNDVRMDMADLLDMASKRGQAMTIEEAYNKACALNPEISQIIKQREEQQRIMGTSQQIQRKRAAASSINGLQGGTQTKEPDSLRGAIEAAWESAMGR